MISLREVTAAEFGGLAELLLRFENPRMRAADFRRMLFDYAWPGAGERRGYAMYDGERAVGFIGTIRSERVIRGKVARFCNLSSWIVLPEHRARSLDLLRRAVSLPDHTFTSLTLAPKSLPVFKRFGHEVLDDETLVLPPLFSPRAFRRLRRAELVTDHDEIAAALPPAARRDFEAHRGTVAEHLMIREGDRAAWVAATPLHLRRVRLAFVQHIGDRGLFWELLPLVQWGFFRALGAPLVAVDARFAAGRRPACALSWRLALPRLWRAATPDLAPTDVDGLYTELMSLHM